MANARFTMGDFGATTRPLANAPQVKSDKEKLLKNFREKLGRKGYSPSEALLMSNKVRGEANALAVEMNARQGNDDPVRMGQIHTLALKLKIKDALKAAPSKRAQRPQQRVSRTSPMAVSASRVKSPKASNSRTMVTALADRGTVLSTGAVRKRGDLRRQKKEGQIYEMEKYRKARGKLKDGILREAMRASYMQQFNGAMGHYGTMGWKKPKWVKNVQKAASKVAAPVQKAAAKVAAPVAKVAKAVAKPIVQASKYVAKKTVEAVKAIGGFLKKILDGLKNLVMKALQPIINFFKKAWDALKKNIIDRVAARFTGGTAKGFGALAPDEQKKITDLTTSFLVKKTAEAAGVQTAILGTASAAATTTATATVTAAAAAGGPAAPATAAAAAPAAATAAAATATPTATAATTAYITKLGTEAVNDIGADFAKYKANKAIPNPVLQKVVGAAIDGKVPTNPEAVKQMAAQLPAQAREEFVKRVEAAPEQAKQEIIKKALVPQEFQRVVNFQSKEAHVLAERQPAIPQLAIAEQMQKSYVKNPAIIAPAPIEAKAIAAQAVIVQDKKALSLAQEGKITPVQAIAASSKIGKEEAIAQLPPQQRAAMVAEVKKEMTNTEVARIEDKNKEEKSKQGTALLTAAAIAAKVLLF